jgi:phage recombination protein Bet
MQLHRDAQRHRTEQEPLRFTAEQEAMILNTYAPGASKEEFDVLMETAKARRVNPILRQVFFVQRYDTEKKRTVWAVQVSIDGLRAMADRSGLYAGQDEPEYLTNEKGELECCKVRVYRSDWPRPVVGVAYWSECVQKTREGGATKFWREKPRLMLAKCAEAQALRKAFPEDTGGIYIEDEMPLPALSEVTSNQQDTGSRSERADAANDNAPETKPSPELPAPAAKASDALAKTIATAKTWSAALALLPAQPDKAVGLAVLARWQRGANAAKDGASIAQARKLYDALPAWVRELAPAPEAPAQTDGYVVEREPGEEG